MIDAGADDDPRDRELAAFVLGQLGWRRAPVPRRAGGGAGATGRARARSGGARRRSPAPSVTSASAHGQAWLLAQREHDDPDVREAVAFALGGRTGDEVAGRADRALRRRRRAGVRDWATFALGTLADADTPGAARRARRAARRPRRGHAPGGRARPRAARRRRAPTTPRASCSPQRDPSDRTSGRATCWPRRPSTSTEP